MRITQADDSMGEISCRAFVCAWISVRTTTMRPELLDASIVIWTTTPWTIPGNHAIAYHEDHQLWPLRGHRCSDDNWARAGDRLILADELAEEMLCSRAGDRWRRFGDVHVSAARDSHRAGIPARQRLRTSHVPLLAGEHVTDDTGTGFVHTAPGHGTRGFRRFGANAAISRSWCVGASTRAIPLHRRLPMATSPRKPPALRVSVSSTTRASLATPMKP